MMRWITRIALAYIFGSAVAASARPRDDHQTITKINVDDDAFAFDVVARANEALRANVDAVDSALTAILAGVVAVIVFTTDKLRDLPDPDRWIAGVLLGAATLTCALGYLIGVSWRGFGKRDGIRQSRSFRTFSTTLRLQGPMPPSSSSRPGKSILPCA
ncbi:MAG: hypothetical protein JO036_17025 [Candidatus Eremiobacteraeota bacterium]|nr:hypothetical protein [Candidatus Eremiobacteraeota bacterium]